MDDGDDDAFLGVVERQLCASAYAATGSDEGALEAHLGLVGGTFVVEVQGSLDEGGASLGAKKACRLVALSANLFIARRALEMGKDDVLIPWDDPEQIPIPEGVRGDDSSSEDEPAVSD